jgi:hypothetical protein
MGPPMAAPTQNFVHRAVDHRAADVPGEETVCQRGAGTRGFHRSNSGRHRGLRPWWPVSWLVAVRVGSLSEVLFVQWNPTTRSRREAVRDPPAAMGRFGSQPSRALTTLSMRSVARRRNRCAASVSGQRFRLQQETYALPPEGRWVARSWPRGRSRSTPFANVGRLRAAA